MRKTFLFLFFAALASTIFAGNCASTSSVSTDYKNGRVTFKLTWTACNNITHRNQVWVFVDYQKVSNGVPTGNWAPATVIGVYSLAPAAVSAQTVTGNKRGLWITGSNGTTATIVLQLDKNNMPTHYKWCAYATDYPPNTTYSNGNYTFKGTPPFTLVAADGIEKQIVNSQTLAESALTVTPSAMTDATGCPSLFCAFMYDGCPVIIACRDLPTWPSSVDNANSLCVATFGAGWRIPTLAELSATCWPIVNKSSSFIKTWYMSSNYYGWHVGSSSNYRWYCCNKGCSTGCSSGCLSVYGWTDPPSDGTGVRCVRDK